jgi:hypothetical protein
MASKISETAPAGAVFVCEDLKQESKSLDLFRVLRLFRIKRMIHQEYIGYSELIRWLSTDLYTNGVRYANC